MKITLIDISEDELQKLNQLQPQIQFPNQQVIRQQWWPNDAYDSDPCKDCLNNPKNGGSGVCNCVLPYMYGSRRVTASMQQDSSYSAV